MIFSRWVRLLSFALLPALAGCFGDEAPNLSGRYFGNLLYGISQVTVSAQIPLLAPREGTGGVIEFSAYELKGSAEGLPFSIQVDRHGVNQLTLTSPALGYNQVSLVRHGSCADGKIEKDLVVLCWTPQTVEISRKSPEGDLLFGMHLKKDDSLPKFGSTERNLILSLETALGRARFNTYKEAQQAEKVYQARNNIQNARSGLMPKLSGKTVLGAILFPTTGFGLVDTVLNLVPFIFPSNWYRVDEAEFKSEAEKTSFASLTGNEINLTETLYYSIDRDQAILKLFDDHLEFMRKVVETSQQQKTLGLISEEVLASLQKTAAAYENDREILKLLLTQELSSFSLSLGVSAISGIAGVEPAALPDMAAKAEINAAQFQAEAQIQSLEIATLRHLLRAANSSRESSTFGILNPSDFVGLAFNFSATVNNAISGQREIEHRIDEVFSEIDKRSLELATEHNLSLHSEPRLLEAVKVAERRLETIQNLGAINPTDIRETVEAKNALLEARAKHLTNSYGYLITEAKLNRLLLRGVYKNLSVPAETAPVQK